MQQLKDFKEFPEAEVGTWLTPRGLGARVAVFRQGGVDGHVLLSLAKDRLKSDLGQSVVQVRRLRRSEDFEVSAPVREGEREGQF